MFLLIKPNQQFEQYTRRLPHQSRTDYAFKNCIYEVKAIQRKVGLALLVVILHKSNETQI